MQTTQFPAAETLHAALIGNHLEFLATHRGRIARDGGTWRCISERPEFCFAVLTEAAGFGGVSDETLYVPSWLAMPAALAERYRHSHSLAYMLRRRAGEEPKGEADKRIRRAADRASIDAFAEAQGRGFCEEEKDYAEWMPWMREADRRNLANPGQDFFVHYDGAKPAACALSLYSNSIAGIYAVATVPAHRRQGRAVALLHHAADAARARGFSLLGLQVVTGSPAETLYLRQGFLPLFEMRIFRPA